MKIAQIAKAVVAGLTTFGGLWVFATTVQTPGGEGVTANEWVSILVPTLVSFVGVWAVQNAPAPTETKSTVTVETTVPTERTSVPPPATEVPPLPPPSGGYRASSVPETGWSAPEHRRR